MGRKIGTVRGAVKERQRIRQGILEQFGEEAIQEAIDRLCSKCGRGSCFLCPLTTKGGDCPYFRLKEGVE